MGGKTLLKFFHEDTWPALQDLLERVDMNENSGFEVFKVFARTDVNEDGLVDLNECFRYLGGKRTKFTERILYSESTVDEVGDIISGLNFKNFLIAIWNYCTLTPAGVARYCFEIFDVDETDMLEKPDLIAMFKMLFNTDDFEEDYVNIYGFDQYPKVSKENFCTISAKKPYLIQPALDYQNVLRRRVGGKIMWAHLTKHRERALRIVDEDERTLSNAVNAIVVSSKNYSKRFDAPTADSMISTSQKKVISDTQMAERELHLQQRRLESETRSMRSTAPDRKMHQAWAILTARRQAFDEEEYLTTDLDRRCRDRLMLFALYDVAKAESLLYWQYKDAYDLDITEGSPADHEARYMDHLATPEGKVMLEFMTLLRLMELVLQDIEDKVAKMKRKPKAKSERQLIFEAQRNELQKILDGLQEADLSAHDRTKRIKFLLERDFTEEHLFAKKNTKKTEQAAAADIARKELCAQLKEKTMRDKRAEIAAAQEERRRGYIIKEFELTTNYGSRTTKWEFVLDKEANKMTYMARDTHEKRHPKTAICETCDGIFVQHELHCDGCNGPRSAKNLKLYRPLGFKDITLE